jgi:hypothetical protein
MDGVGERRSGAWRVGNLRAREISNFKNKEQCCENLTKLNNQNNF